MKKLVFLIALTLVITGCGKEEPAVEMMEQSSEEIKSLELISETISQALLENQNLNYISNAAIDQLPEGINKNQIPKTDSEDVTKLYAFKDVAFMFVNHTQTGNEWSGVLAKNKGNGEWTKLLTSPRQTHNPSEMSTRNGKLHLTIEEDSEIHNSLYFFTTDGITWTEENL
ncbi:hypothetical protein HOF40_00705 [Candidatus Parcubacteria bacterium]|jgi:hypothetical protein|nr:hypothetical protein [Candidatus Parcubacteria bacterium]MBT3948590.1 hypothetical protein [Candidatus Parcubacteria bacterium]